MSLLFAWGLNSQSQLGMHVPERRENLERGRPCLWQPAAVSEDAQVTACFAGEAHTLVLDKYGTLLGCGRNKEGQLGLGHRAPAVEKLTPVQRLAHEIVVSADCGALHSAVVTASGRLYMMGLVQKEKVEPSGANGGDGESKGNRNNTESDRGDDGDEDEDDEDNDRPVGQLTGLANQTRDARLEAVVRWSTNKYLTAGADDAYYEELRALGYEKEELDDISQNRQREYTGMLKMQARRQHQAEPTLIRSLFHHRVVAVACGYGHTLALTDTGHVFSNGYNDRGQLGLGHRISVSSFHLVEPLAKFTTVQIACGSEHSLARVLPSRRQDLLPLCGPAAPGSSFADGGRPGLASASNSGVAGASTSVTTAIGHVGGDLFSWGSGTFGQLGHGSGKGRLVPTLVQTLREECPQQVADVSCGANFTVAVSMRGVTYSFGHAEFCQHGVDTVQGRAHDHTFDPYKYYQPQRVEGLNDVEIARVCCGAASTLALSKEGHVFSWGWPSYGCLGLGRGHFSLEPTRILSLGGPEKRVTDISSGAQFCLTVTTPEGNAHGASFAQLVHDTSFADVVISVEDTGQIFYAHSAVLEARSKYFKGMLRAARSDPNARVRLRMPKTHSHTMTEIPAGATSFAGPSAANSGSGGSSAEHADQRSSALPSGNNGLMISASELRDHVRLRKVRRAAAAASARQQQQQPAGATSAAPGDDEDALRHHRSIHQDLAAARLGRTPGHGDDEHSNDDDHLAAAAAGSAASPEELLRQAAERVLQLEPDEEVIERELTHLNLSGRGVQPITVRFLLLYFYTDRISCPSHKRRPIAELAHALGLDRLEQMSLKLMPRREKTIYAREKNIPRFRLDDVQVPASSFEQDMSVIFDHADTADVRFVSTPPAPAAAPPQEQEQEQHCLHAHRCILATLPYFRVLFTGGFAEADAKLPRDKVDGGRELEYDVTSLEADGIPFLYFREALRFLYTGTTPMLPSLAPSPTPSNRDQADSVESKADTDADGSVAVGDDSKVSDADAVADEANEHGEDEADAEDEPDVDMAAVMHLLLAANRLGIQGLVHACEGLLSAHMTDYPDNAANLLAFASSFNFPRLEMQCRDLLASIAA